MAVFTILLPPDGKPDKAVFLAEGFSWSALFFTMLWALWHRLWLVAALLIVVFAGLSVALSLRLADPTVVSVLQVGLGLLLGLEGQNLRLLSLERAGYRQDALISADSREAAELTYFAGLPSQAQAHQAAPARLRGEPADTLGIFGNV